MINTLLLRKKIKIKTTAALLFFQLVIVSCQKEEKKTVITETKTTVDTIKTTKTEEKIDYNNFNIFSLSIISSAEKDSDMDIFISVSDIYKGVQPVPADILKNQKQMTYEERQHFELDAPSRKKLLEGIHLTDNDSLYIYGYGSNKLQRIPISQLKAVAYLSPYTDSEDLDPDSYMMGFQVATHQKITDSDKFDNAIAYFGNKNPFVENKMKAMKWQKAGADISKKYFSPSKLISGKTYQTQYENMTYYLQDYLEEGNITERRLAVINDHKEKIAEKTFSLAGSDGGEFLPLYGIDTDEANIFQYTGHLFKGKPPVVFGFIAQSFGCPSISFLDKKERDFPINCDNRH
ncbi:hypothetical protein FW781_13400 [Chryseobacterium panacisoli]|uniref:Uncharacterized protein n=1 Tax=Chryseobacterium panacisoli TaxID=1807141 RepID=A0A5D8ZLD4_9FLAO|nr:hypothetical protein [Chryseobacterium panacisoli]TZF94892.1 hypothetical protein FW781_13400 [Chryseobacterium panacisoli]